MTLDKTKVHSQISIKVDLVEFEESPPTAEAVAYKFKLEESSLSAEGVVTKCKIEEKDIRPLLSVFKGAIIALISNHVESPEGKVYIAKAIAASMLQSINAQITPEALEALDDAESKSEGLTDEQQKLLSLSIGSSKLNASES